MVASLTTLCNTERAQRESRAREGSTKRGQGQYKGRSPKAPARRRMVLVFYWLPCWASISRVVASLRVATP
jgi:hypothetical protein